MPEHSLPETTRIDPVNQPFIPPAASTVADIAVPSAIQSLLSQYGTDPKSQFAILLMAHELTQKSIATQGSSFAEAINLLRQQVEVLRKNQEGVLEWIRNRDTDLAKKLHDLKDELTKEFSGQVSSITTDVGEIKDFLKPQKFVDIFIRNIIKNLGSAIIIGLGFFLAAIIMYHFHLIIVHP